MQFDLDLLVGRLQGKAKQDKAKQDKAKQVKAKQDKAKQGKARQSNEKKKKGGKNGLLLIFRGLLPWPNTRGGYIAIHRWAGLYLASIKCESNRMEWENKSAAVGE